MKKGRKYIEPVTGKGDKKVTPKVGTSGMTWDGISRPANDTYREQFNRIFRKEENAE